MMRPSSAKTWGVLLGLGVLGDAYAATLSIEPDVVLPRGTVVFHITTDHEMMQMPGGVGYGPEAPHSLSFNGACLNSINFGWGFDSPYGQAFDVPFPAAGWTNYNVLCSDFKNPGQYVATLDYRRFDGVAAPHYFIDVPFTVLANLGVQALPSSIAAGSTTGIYVLGGSPADPATSLQVECPDGSTDHAVDVTPIDDGYSFIWPGLYFAGGCDSSQPGGYGVTVTTERRSTKTHFSVFADRDYDGVLDGYDDCPTEPNANQQDTDGDGRGDACETDRDNDGHRDEQDNCPDVANAPQDDLDVDGLGDSCDADRDADGVLDAADNCPRHPNPGQENADGDAFGDLCDPDPEDVDNDGMNDLVDNCWNVFNPAQQDDDHDGIGTACDPDIDGDGISNADEAVAGTNPNDPQPLDEGINSFWEGGAIGSGVSVPDGEPVGVVVNPPTDVDSIDVTVVDPWGNPYAQKTLIPQSPVAFYFVPVWPGTWRIDADLNNGEVLSAPIQVIPEPAAAIGCLAAVATLLALRRR
jgi:Thrombospondin type 3 repeat/Bacterial TSP3 repeat